MTPETQDRLDEFFAGFAGAGKPHLLLDYDGTLSAFRVDRFQSRPYDGVRETLGRIQREGRTRMAVITGRPAAEIGPMLGLETPLEVWGLHGAERMYPDGRRVLEEAPAATQAKLEELREHLRRDNLGGLFEDKANGVVMHWRGVSRRKAEQVEQRARDLFEPLARLEGLALLDFESGVELRTGRNKGGAAQAILDETDDGGPAAFLGDDLSDEAAFRVVQRVGRRGLTAMVRKEWRETAAELWLQPPSEVVHFLKRWAEAVEGDARLF